MRGELSPQIARSPNFTNANAFCQLFFGLPKLETITRGYRHIVEQKNLMSAISLLLKNHAGKICVIYKQVLAYIISDAQVNYSVFRNIMEQVTVKKQKEGKLH